MTVVERTARLGRGGRSPARGSAAVGGEGGAQRLVARDDRAEARATAPAASSAPAQAQCARHVVGGAARAPAGRGTTAAAARRRAAARPSRCARHERRQRRPCLPRAARVDLAPPGRATRRRCSKTARSGSSTPNARRTRDEQPRGQQRVAAEREEVVVAPDPLDAQHLRPERRRASPRSACAARRSAAASRAPLGRGQRLAVDLAVGRRAAARRAPRTRTAPCSPAAAATAAARSGVVGGATSSRDDDTPTRRASPGASSRATTTRLAHAGVLRQRGLDLAELDAVAAHLHLVVDAAEELERAVGAPAARRSPVRYSRAPAAAENGSGTKRSAVSAGRRR